MRRSMYIGLAAVLAFGVLVTGCGKEPEPMPDPVEPVDTPPPPPPPRQDPPPPPPPAPQLMAGDMQDVFFDFDKATLTAAARTKLQGNHTKLNEVTSARITIEGHCDERGTVEYNLALGERRAKAAKDYLVSLGIPGSRIKTVSYGENRPFDLGHNEAAWAKNRRAHFTIDSQ